MSIGNVGKLAVFIADRVVRQPKPRHTVAELARVELASGRPKHDVLRCLQGRQVVGERRARGGLAAAEHIALLLEAA